MYRASLIIFLTAILCWFTGCVERYYPNEDNLKTGTLVINAHLTNKPGTQVIEISRSVTLLYPSADPVSGGFVEVIREDGDIRAFMESRPGFYETDLDADFLQIGMSYMLHAITPDGNEYESDFDKLRPVPEIDSIYYQVETNSFATESDSMEGVRFYIDFSYSDEDYDYLRWDLEETYEFHNPDMEGFIFDVDFSFKPLSDTNNYKVCYITNELSQIHSMSLGYLDFGVYVKKPFAFVPNIQMEQKLKHKYSLLVRQYSMGQAAFHYWNELKKTSQEQGWLFDRQPALLKSNLRNINDEDEVVLGFFSMSSVIEKRAYATHPEGLDLRLYEWYCFPVIKGPSGPITRDDLPKYYGRAWRGGKSVQAEVNRHCVDCRFYKNSSHIKPDFW